MLLNVLQLWLNNQSEVTFIYFYFITDEFILLLFFMKLLVLIENIIMHDNIFYNIFFICKTKFLLAS